MRIKTTCFLFTVLLFLGLISGCNKEKQTVLENEWVVKSLKEHPDSSRVYPDSERKQTLEFDSDEKKFGLYTTCNECWGDVDFEKNNGIDFKGVLCTQVGCDSDFERTFSEITRHRVNKYEIQGSVLILNGDRGERITLKRITK